MSDGGSSSNTTAIVVVIVAAAVVFVVIFFVVLYYLSKMKRRKTSDTIKAVSVNTAISSTSAAVNPDSMAVEMETKDGGFGDEMKL